MNFSELSDTLARLSETTKRLEMISILAELFKKTDPDVIDKVVYMIQGKLYPDYVGIETGIAEKTAAKVIANVSGVSIAKVEELASKLGDLGDVAEKLLNKKAQVTLFSEQLTVEKVYSALDKTARTTGSGAQEMKQKILSGLLSESKSNEAKFLIRFVIGTLRLGVADYTILDGLAQAFSGGKDSRNLIERAYNVSSDLGLVAKVLSKGGKNALNSFSISVGRPIRPMLAERLTTAQEVVEKMKGEVSVEYKLDGERVQIHKNRTDILLFSRRLEKITHHYPDVVSAAKKNLVFDVGIVEGEIVAINQDTGELRPFQELMHRRRKYEVEKAMEGIPTVVYLFDILSLKGRDLTQQHYHVRRKLLIENLKEDISIRVVPNIITSKPEEIEKFMNKAISDGCEGVVVKDLNGTYRAGAREFSWIKLKREYRSELADTLDLVIIGAFYGKGKRTGKYGTFLLAAYDDDKDIFESISKVGTGFTDENLDKFKRLLNQYKIKHAHSRVNSKIEPDVWFIPQVVIEVAASEITFSPIYTAGYNKLRKDAGLALRFPKFTGRIRDDKNPEDATTVKEVIELYQKRLSRIQPASSDNL
ncbi:MAG: ATP-dependent DNA ligase [Nitrososphaeria archaeon]|jgi:DNA ligase-1